MVGNGLSHLLTTLPFPVLALAPEQWLTAALRWFSSLFPEGHFFSIDFNVRAFLALILVSVCCGAVGSLVVGGRLAFFSDALAHCAFAGVSIGFLLFTLVIRPCCSSWQTTPPTSLSR